MDDEPQPWTGEGFRCTCPDLPCPMHGSPITRE